jgi:UDP-GlcNAc:undecaprenyl-phosphate/decaprenyl-phosphate GlcNAc-1-phosphate transferase
VKAAATLAALPVALLATWALLRSPLARRVVAAPRGDRWHEKPTPLVGGVAIALGLAAGIALSLAVGEATGTRVLAGVAGGCLLLFAAGLADDLWSLNPLAKLAAQVGAAAMVVGAGLKAEIVTNDALAVTLAMVWLVGMTNAFNFLDNIDGLAATLAAIAAACFAVDSLTIHKDPTHVPLVLALSLAFACVGFLPFNLRPGRSAATFMGDSGSQMLGFLLASLGLASSWKAASTTVATLLLPLLILAVPILDTTLVTVVRLLEGRPVYRGGRDHTSHRLVSRGLSDTRAVVLLALISAALGATSLAYAVIGDQRVTLLGVLVSFALLVQFGSFLSDVERDEELPSGPFAAIFAHRRRLIEVLVDFALISVAFATAYFLNVDGSGTVYQRHIATMALPAVLFARYATFIPFGLYRGVWRYAGARDAANILAAVVVSEILAFTFLAATQDFRDFPRSIFVVDALLAFVLIGASRFAERALDRGLSGFRDRAHQHRTLIVGAGRSGRSLMRELRETAGERVVGLVDDDPALRRRRLQGTPVLGTLDEIGYVLGHAQPDAVLVTIPEAPRMRLDLVLEACERAGIACRFVRREIDLDPEVVLGATAE